MSEKTQTEILSRRKIFSILGLATLALAVPSTVLTVSTAEAQAPSTPPTPQTGATAAPQTGRQQRRLARRQARTERRQARRQARIATTSNTARHQPGNSAVVLFAHASPGEKAPTPKGTAAPRVRSIWRVPPPCPPGRATPGVPCVAVRGNNRRGAFPPQLGRIARTEPGVSDAAINALEDIDQPRADAISNSGSPRHGGAPVAAGHKVGGGKMTHCRRPLEREPARPVAIPVACP